MAAECAMRSSKTSETPGLFTLAEIGQKLVGYGFRHQAECKPGWR